MDKRQVQKRVLQNGKKLALNKFTWDKKTNTFSSSEDNLVLDFKDLHGCTFKTGNSCTFNTRSYCTFKTFYNCTFNTGWGCAFNTKGDCTFKTGGTCTFNTGSYCTFNTRSYCTFKTDNSCTFNTKGDCTFDTRSSCTFSTDGSCTFNTDWDCVIVRRDEFEVIQPNADDTIQLCPFEIEGYLVNGKLDGVPHIIADGILSKIINQKGDVYKVINHGEMTESFLVKQGEIFSHGGTLKEARESLIYKLVNKDTSQYEGMSLDTELSLAESIEMYRSITGACSSETRNFVEQNQDKVKDKFTIKELIELTKGRYNNETF